VAESNADYIHCAECMDFGAMMEDDEAAGRMSRRTLWTTNEWSSESTVMIGRRSSGDFPREQSQDILRVHSGVAASLCQMPPAGVEDDGLGEIAFDSRVSWYA
jgi:hypothetical protein